MKTQTAATISLLATQEFATKPETLLDQIEAYSVAQFVEELAKNRKDALRETLLKEAEGGELTEKGGYRLEVEDYTVLKEKRTATSPDENKLMKLCEARGINLDDAFDRVSMIQANPSKLARLVATGHLSEEEAAGLYKVTHALVVHADRVKSALSSAVPASLAPKKRGR